MVQHQLQMSASAAHAQPMQKLAPHCWKPARHSWHCYKMHAQHQQEALSTLADRIMSPRTAAAMWLFWCHHTVRSCSLCRQFVQLNIPARGHTQRSLMPSTPATKLALIHISKFATVQIPALSTPIHGPFHGSTTSMPKPWHSPIITPTASGSDSNRCRG